MPTDEKLRQEEMINKCNSAARALQESQVCLDNAIEQLKVARTRQHHAIVKTHWLKGEILDNPQAQADRNQKEHIKNMLWEIFEGIPHEQIHKLHSTPILRAAIHSLVGGIE